MIKQFVTNQSTKNVLKICEEIQYCYRKQGTSNAQLAVQPRGVLCETAATAWLFPLCLSQWNTALQRFGLQCNSAVASSQPLQLWSSGTVCQGDVSGRRCVEHVRWDVRFPSCHTIDAANSILLNCNLFQSATISHFRLMTSIDCYSTVIIKAMYYHDKNISMFILLVTTTAYWQKWCTLRRYNSK